jgi:hypothetical protein
MPTMVQSPIQAVIQDYQAQSREKGVTARMARRLLFPSLSDSSGASGSNDDAASVFLTYFCMLSRHFGSRSSASLTL